MRLHVWHVAHFTYSKTVYVQNYLLSSILLFEGNVFSICITFAAAHIWCSCGCKHNYCSGSLLYEPFPGAISDTYCSAHIYVDAHFYGETLFLCSNSA